MLQTQENDRRVHREEDDLRRRGDAERLAEVTAKCEKLEGFCRENTRGRF